MDDLISRQAAIDALRTHERKVSSKWFDNQLDVEWNNAIDICCYDIEELPSAQPETAKRIVGKSRDGMTLWYQCDMCNEPVDAKDDFCRGCGRRLVDEGIKYI